MAAASYTTDLQVITTCDSGSFVELTGWTEGTLQSVPETDYYIQGNGCVSSTVKDGNNSIGFDYGSGITIPTDGAVLFWQTLFAPNSLATYASGGQRCFIGSAQGAFRHYFSGGNDYTPNPYGGWKNIAVDPVNATPDATSGTPSSTYQYFGVGAFLPTTYPGKGAPFGMDAVRYGQIWLQRMIQDQTDGVCSHIRQDHIYGKVL
jgi:hypothetical protein